MYNDPRTKGMLNETNTYVVDDRDDTFALNKDNAEFKDGLLKITIPFAKGSELKTLAIK